MTVEIRKDSVGQYVQLGGGFTVPSIDTKNVTTQIPVNNGDTAVIGGIYEETINNDVTKVPFLGDIPMLGYLFKTTGTHQREDRAADLPDAAHRQGIGHRGVRGAGERRARGALVAAGAVHAIALECPGAPASGQFLSGRPAGRGQVDARPACSRGASASASSTPTSSSSARSASRFRPSSKSRAKRDSAIARKRSLAELVQRTGHRARDRWRRRDPRRRIASGSRRTAPSLYLHATPATLWERTRQQPAPAAAASGRSAGAARRAVRAARPALPRDRATCVVESDRERGDALRAGISRRRRDAHCAAMADAMRTLTVALGARSYPIHIGAGTAWRRRARCSRATCALRARSSSPTPSSPRIWLAPLARRLDARRHRAAS